MLRSVKLPSLPDSSRDIKSSKILELKSRCPGLVEKVHETEFSLSFSSLNVNYELTIILPPKFPFVGPVLQVQPAAVHPLLDETSTVCGLTELTAFSIHASVPDIVHQVLSHFITIPLRRLEPMAQSRATSSGHTMYMNGSSHRPVIYPQLNDLSVEDLRDWSTDDMKITEFVENMAHVKARKEMLKSISDTNEALARSNLSMLESLEQERDKLLSQCEEFSQLRAEFQKNQDTFQLLAKSFAPETIQDGLVRAAHASEEQSDAVAEQFFQKQIGVEDFLKSFMEIRTRNHERLAKAEALKGQLIQLYRSGY